MRYGDSGFASLVRCGRHSASHGSFCELDARRHLAQAAARPAVQAIRQRFVQQAERELRVADQRVLGRDCFVDVGGVDGVVDECLSRRREANAVVGRREARADAEHEIGLRDVHRDGARQRSAARAERQRMVLGERALAFEARRDRRLEQLGDGLELGPRFRVVHALPCIDQGRRAASSTSAALSTDCASGADRHAPRRAVLDRSPGTSAVHMSAGISTRPGPGARCVRC